jgi:hypothetical protein
LKSASAFNKEWNVGGFAWQEQRPRFNQKKFVVLVWSVRKPSSIHITVENSFNSLFI